MGPINKIKKLLYTYYWQPRISWMHKNDYQKLLPGFLPLNDNIKCAIVDACTNGTHIWISHKIKAIYFETPKAASSTMRYLLETSNPIQWFYRPKFLRYAKTFDKNKIEVETGYFSKTGKINTAYMNVLTEILDVCKKNKIKISNEKLIKLAHQELSTIIETENHDLSFREKERPTQHGFQMYYGTPLQAAKQFHSYFKFSIVRNPYEKMVSNYVMFYHGNPVRKKQIKLLFGDTALSYDFKTFLKLSNQIPNHHWEQYINYLPLEKSRLLIDAVLKMDEVNEKLPGIMKIIGIKNDVVHLNRTGHKRYREYYDTETREVIVNMFNDDIELFKFRY